MSVVPVQKRTGAANTTPGATGNFSFSTLPTAGNAVFVDLHYALSGGTNVIITSVTDNQSNTYSLVKNSFPGFGGSTFLYWCPSIGTPTGTFTVTVNISNSSQSSGWDWGLLEASGLAGTVDKTGEAHASTGTTLTATATGANTTADSLVIASMMLGNFNSTPALTTPPNTGYTVWINDQNSGTSNGQTGASSGYKVVSSIETSSGAWAWTGSGNNGGIVATFQGGATTPPAAVPSAPLAPLIGNKVLGPLGMAGFALRSYPNVQANANVTVGLTGQAATFAGGISTPSLSRAQSGQAASFAAGTVAVSVAKALTGAAVTSAAGTLGPNTARALTGQPATFAAGTLSAGSDVTAALTGQASTFAAGTSSPGTTLAPTGQAGTFSAGTLTTTNDVTVSLTGQAATFTAGVVAPSVSIALLGGAASFATGNLLPSAARALPGAAISSAAGTVSPATSTALQGLSASFAAGIFGVVGDVTVALTGASAGFSPGALSVAGGAQAGPTDQRIAEGHYRRKKKLRKIEQPAEPVFIAPASLETLPQAVIDRVPDFTTLAQTLGEQPARLSERIDSQIAQLMQIAAERDDKEALEWILKVLD